MLSRRTAALVISLILACYGQVDIQPRPKRPDNQEKPPLPTLRVDTTLVLVPVTVSDPMKRTVTGLGKENFRLFDDGVEQTITQFAREDEAIAVGFVFDASGSMGDKLNRSRLAAREFFKTGNPEDEFFLVEFDSSPKLVVPLTRDIGAIENEVLFSRSRGSTALLDAVLLGLGEIRKSTKNKKALLIVSDGGENHSRYSEGELRNVLRESDMLIYAVGVFGGGRTPEETGGPELLTRIAEQTGGRMLSAGWAEIPDIARAISLELRNRYVLGFSPRNPQRDGRYHRLQVKIISPRGMPRLSAHWRTGYYAPMQW